MARKRSLAAGGTDYTGVTLADIVDHLRDWQRWTASTISKLEEYRSEVERRAELLESPRDVQSYLDYFIDLLKRYESDLGRLVGELPSGVRSRHVEIVKQLYESSRFEEDRCVSFKRDFIERRLPHEEMRYLLDHIYAESRDQLIDFRDLSNVAARLRTFVSDLKSVQEEPILQLRPNLWGLGVNLRPLWARLRQCFQRRAGGPPGGSR